MATLATGDRRIDLARAEDFDLGAARARPSLLEIEYDGTTELVEPRVMQMLVALYRARGSAVSRDELILDCWGGLVVSDDAINKCVSKLRRALVIVPDIQVVSIPRVGYRLVQPVMNGNPEAGRNVGMGRRMILAGTVVGVATAGTGGWYFLRPGAGSAGDAIAVLPFVNLSGDPSQAYFSDGITEEVRTALARISGLKVVGRTSSEAVRDLDSGTVAQQLHVTNILTGSVRRSRTTVRVAAQLIDGRTGYERWAQTYDFATGDTLRLQSEIAQGVALALSVKLGRSDRITLAAGGTRNSTAHDLYLQAKLAFRQSDTEATYRKVIALCDAAIDLDPNYADAYALKGIAWDAIGSSFAADMRSLRQAYARGADAARKAIVLAPQLASGYVALARSMSGRLHVRGALELYRKAEPLFAADPGLVSSWILTLAEIGRTAESLATAKKWIALDPLNAALFGRQAFAHYFARRYALAIASARKALELAPGLTEQQSLLGDCLSLLGKYRQAADEYAKAPPLDPYRITGEAILAARTGDHSISGRLLENMKRAFGDTMSFQQAQVHAQRGELDQAFAALERGRLLPDPGMNGLPADPFVDPLRGDARFAALIETLDFPRS